ncbi:hypothetical protein V8E54_009690, partial [Elaphomyces granulatus]
MFDPAFPQQNVDKVIIKHPAYSDQNELLSLNAWDNGSGIHFGTVLLACQLVACNEFNGFLTKDQNGTQRITDSEDSVLEPGIYFFHVRSPQPDIYRYPIYSCFKDWRYPHDNVPNSWVRPRPRTSMPAAATYSNGSHAIIVRDGKCCVSRYQDGLERTHLCPRAEREWFDDNSMRRYCHLSSVPSESFIDDQANSISLRADIHRCFDKGDFVIVRKEESWVAHFLKETNQLGRIFHNRQVIVNKTTGPDFLLAHFAWALFPYMKDMFNTNRDRLVRLR